VSSTCALNASYPPVTEWLLTPYRPADDPDLRVVVGSSKTCGYFVVWKDPHPIQFPSGPLASVSLPWYVRRSYANEAIITIAAGWPRAICFGNLGGDLKPLSGVFMWRDKAIPYFIDYRSYLEYSSICFAMFFLVGVGCRLAVYYRRTLSFRCAKCGYPRGGDSCPECGSRFDRSWVRTICECASMR